MKLTKKNCDLKSCAFCQGCLKEWLPALDTNRQTFQVKKGEVLFTEGETVDGIYFVYEGAVKVHQQWGDKELIIRFAKKGEIVGHRGLGTESFFPITATALEPSLVCFISLDFFLSSLKVNPAFLFQLLIFFADELRESEQKMRNMAHMPLKGRLAKALLSLKEKFGIEEDGYINLTFTKQDLASYTGATYESVFRILNEFSEEGLIKISGKAIGLLNDKKLVEISARP